MPHIDRCIASGCSRKGPVLLLSSWNVDVTQNWREEWKSCLQKRVQDNVCKLYTFGYPGLCFLLTRFNPGYLECEAWRVQIMDYVATGVKLG